MPFDLEAEIASRLGVPAESVAPVLQTVVERIRQQVSHYGYARMAGLGTFRADNGHLTFEPDAVLSDEVNVSFAGLEQIDLPDPTREAMVDQDRAAVPPDLAAEKAEEREAVDETTSEFDDKVEAEPYAVRPDEDDWYDEVPTDAFGEEDVERGEAPGEGVVEEDAEHGEAPGEGFVEEDLEYGEAPGEDVEEDTEYGEAPGEDVVEEDTEYGEAPGEDVVEEDTEYGEAPGEEYERSDLGDELAKASDDVYPLEDPGASIPTRDADSPEDMWDEETTAEFEDEEEAAWKEQPDESHPLGPLPEAPIEDADYAVLDEREEAESFDEADAPFSADADEAEDVPQPLKAGEDDIAPFDEVEADVADEVHLVPEGASDVGEGVFEEEEEEEEEVFEAGGFDEEVRYEEDVDRWPPERSYAVDAGMDYGGVEDDAFEDEAARADDLGAEDDEEAPSVQWNPLEEQPEAGLEGEIQEEGEEEDASAGPSPAAAYAAAGASGLSGGDESAHERDEEVAPEHAPDRAAAPHERLRKKVHERHPAASSTGAGAAGGNRSAILIGVGIIVLVAAAVVIYFVSLPPAGDGPMLAEDRQAQTPTDTAGGGATEEAAAEGETDAAVPDEAGAPAGDDDPRDPTTDPGETPAEAPARETPPAPAAQGDADPLRSAEGIDEEAGGYTLIVFSETSESSAGGVSERLRNEGFRTGVLEDSETATTRYRVGVGQFETLDEAVAARDRLAGNELPDDTWVRRIR